MLRQTAPPLWTVVGAITAFAFIARYAGSGFGLPDLFHPDEELLIDVSLRLSTGNDLNPHLFHYGGAHFYLVAALFRVADLAGLLESKSDAYVIARTLSAVLGAASVALTMSIVHRLYASVALAALTGVIFSFTMLHVRCAHYATVDVPATFWMLAAVWLLIDRTGVPRASPRWLLAAGVAAGVAVGTKYHLAFIVPTLAVVAGSRSTKAAATVCAAAAAGFLATNPYALLDHNAFVSGIRELLTHYDRPQLHPRNQGDRNWLFYLSTLGNGESDWFVLGTAVLGVIALLKVERRLFIAALAAFPLATFVYLSARSANYIRNLLPLVPFLATASALGIVSVMHASRNGAVRQYAVRGVIAIALLISVARVVRMDRMLVGEDTRQSAGRWIATNVPSDAKIAVERERWATPPLPGKSRVSLMILPEYPLSVYREHGFQYIITTSVSYQAYFAYPGRMPGKREEYRRFFEMLDTNAVLVARFVGPVLDVPLNDELPNPEIRVYRLVN